MTEQDMEDVLDCRRRRALYRAQHRGTREMDFLLGRYARHALATMTQGELESFERLMAVPDPVLMAALVEGIGTFDPALAGLIGQIRQFHEKSLK